MKKKRKTDLTADEIKVWAEQLSGQTVKEIADRHDVTTRTVYNWLENAKQQIGTIDVDEVRQCFFSLIPDAFDAIKHCLTINKDGQIALRLLSGLTILTDKREVEHSDKQSAPGELRRRIEQLVTSQDQGTDQADRRTAS